MGRRATFVGLVFLIFPVFLGNSAMGQVVAKGLSVPGFLLLALGALVWVVSMASEKPSSEPLEPRPPTDDKGAERQPHRAPGSQKYVKPVAPASDVADVRAKLARWSPQVFADIEWRRFEAVCEKLFAQAGFETKSQSHGADGGVDIWLHSRNAEGPVAVVQCKHWQGKAVGVKEIREFFGVMASHKLTRGTYATTSAYTADAQRFAKDNGINTLDGAGLLALISKRTPEQQKALLDVAYEGEYWRPTCASCGIKLVERTPRNGGARFWGCSQYPRCKSRLPMAATLQ